MNAIEILADDSRGAYIPQHFAEAAADGWKGIPPRDRLLLLRGPTEDLYWDTWLNVLDNARYEKDGNVWHLHHDCDLFAICDELLTDQERQDLFNEA